MKKIWDFSSQPETICFLRGKARKHLQKDEEYKS